MAKLFPGTLVQRTDKSGGDFLFGIFTATKGITLAQLREITGLDAPAVQNWINRGWVQKTSDKRYSIDQLARIMIINMLRDVMKLENIAMLLSYINGVAGDASDDIISESRLYGYICTILDSAGFEQMMSPQTLDRLVAKTLSDYTEPVEGAKQKLTNALKIILLYYSAAIVKKRANTVYDEVFSEQGGARVC